MIGFKKTPIRLVLITFLISVVSIILIYVDSLNNEPLAIEEITICLLYTSDAADDP